MKRFPDNPIISLVGESPRYELGESVGPDLRVADLLDASGRASLADLRLGYATPQGDPRLRQAIADAHGVDPDEVIVTVGGMHALFLIAFVLCGPADEAVTTSPSFPLARNALDAVGAAVRIMSPTFDRGYRVDADELGRQLSSKTRLVSLASPQNPSGVAIASNTLEAVLAVMAKVCPQAYLLVDETYREAAYADDPVAASAMALSPKVICIASLSKSHGAPGLRLGWAITRDPALREQLVLAKFNTVISCSPIDEALALRVLERSEPIINERRRHLAHGLALTARWVVENSEFVEWVRPDAGAMCCVRLKPSVFVDDAAVSQSYAVLATNGVRVASGTWFGEPARVFRLGFGLLSIPELELALGALSESLRQAAPVAV